MKISRCFSSAAILAAIASAPVVRVSAADLKPEEQWPAWRGPLATGVAPKANPPTEWSETKNVKWKVAVPGSGTATPIVWGDRIYLLTAIPSEKKEAASLPRNFQVLAAQPAPGGPPGDRRRPGGGRGRGDGPTESFQFSVISLDRATGKTVWQKTATEQVPHEGHHQTHGYASGSPVTDGRMLYAYFGSRGLYAMDLNGEIKWSADFGDQQTRNGFGEGTSPALAGNTILVNWDHEGPDDFIVALDKTTGKELWRKSREEKTSWATPYILEHDGVVQAVVNATGAVRSYNVKNGDVVWESSGQTDNAIPSVVSGHGLFFVMSGFRGSALQAIKIGAKGKVMDTDAIAWSYNRGTPYVPSPLIYGDQLFFLSGNSARLSIFDAKTGERHVEAEKVGDMTDVYAAPVGAGGRVYLAGRDGRFAVIKQGPKLEILAQSRLDDAFDAVPVPVGNDLFLRGHKSLYCIAEN
jgi:outer membrane protein assembly factor BamB